MDVVYEPFPTTPISEFFPELRFEFVDLPDELFVYYTRRVAIDMAEKGNILRRWARIELQPCVTRYALISPDGLKLWAIMGIFRSRGCPDRAESVRRTWGPPEDACLCDKNTAWYDPYDDVLHYNGACDCSFLHVNMAVVPPRDACKLPSIYMERFFDTLLMGVRAKIMLITGQEWTNLRVGSALQSEYESMLKREAVRVAERRQRGLIKIQFGRVM